ncbi:hypothetical protein ABFS83_14G032000 [Erythranthe nasuta]
MAKLYLPLVLAVLVLAHATARNIPTDEEATRNPSTNTALAPTQNMAENVVATTAAAPRAAVGGVDDEKNFISYGGMGGWGGVGGYVGVMPVFGGIGAGMGAAGGIGGVGGLGGVGLGKVGGIGVAGGVGGVGGVGGIIP